MEPQSSKSTSFAVYVQKRGIALSCCFEFLAYGEHNQIFVTGYSLLCPSSISYEATKVIVLRQYTFVKCYRRPFIHSVCIVHITCYPFHSKAIPFMIFTV